MFAHKQDMWLATLLYNTIVAHVLKHSRALRKVYFSWFGRGGVEDMRLEAKAKDTKKSEAKDSLFEDRHSRGQGQGWRTQAQVLSKIKKKGLHQNFSGDLKKKKGLHKNFSSDLQKKNVFQKIFQSLHKILTIQKIMLSSSQGQANFRGLQVSRPRPRTWPSRPRTSKSVLKAKDVLEDSTSVIWNSSWASCSLLSVFPGSHIACELINPYCAIATFINLIV